MFCIGVVADVQYAARVDKPPRYYRAAPEKLRAVLEVFNQHDLSCVLHLGDLIDRGWNNFIPVLEAVQASKFPFRCVLGNHDLKVPDGRKAQVPERLGMPGRYYHFVLENWMFVMLDGTEVSGFAHPAGSPEQAAALALREKYAPSRPGNGGIGPVQRAWLTERLEEAGQSGQQVALCCHYPIASIEHPQTQLLNAAEIRDLIAAHSSVRLWLNGHRHDGSYRQIPNRAGQVIHHLNLKGLVETRENSGAVLEFHEDRIRVQGLGREPSRELML